MAAVIVCPSCEATVQPPGGRAAAARRCPWCDAALPPAEAFADEPVMLPEARFVIPVSPAPSPQAEVLEIPEEDSAGGRWSQWPWAAAILLASAVLAAGGFVAARFVASLVK